MITSEINSTIVKIVEKAIKECSMHYGFNSDEAMFRLGLKELNSLSLKETNSLSLKETNLLSKEVKEVVVVEKKEKPKKIVLPYSSEYDNACCSGLELNHGLYTQCLKKKKVNDLCEGCNKQALKNEHGKPDYGRIEERQEQGLMEFRDPKGKSPVSYIKVMKKLGLSREEVLEEAEKKNKYIYEIHFLEEEEEDKNNKKGRPKKSKKELEVEGETNDLFAELVASSASSSSIENPNTSPVVSPKKLPTTPRLEEEESPKEKVVKEKVVKEKPIKEKVVKEVENDSQPPSLSEISTSSDKEKVEESPKEKVVKEKVVKEKVVKEKVVKEKVVKEPKEKKVKPVKEKVVKEQENNSEPSSPVPEISTSSDNEEEVEEGEVKEVEVLEEGEVEEADVVKRFEHEGIKYLKSKKTGIIYNMEQDVIGKWNEELKKIDFNEAGEEEEEDEYDE
jgi:hypothetical protein